MPAILVLAAGSSSRLGRPKQLLQYEGKTLLRRAAETAVAAAAGAPVLVVTGALHEELLPELANLPVATVRCVTWAEGMGASIKYGLAVLESLCATWRSLLIILCDQPHVTPELLRRLVQKHEATSQPIVASEYDGVRGVPAFFSWEVLGLLRQLPSGAGAGQIFKQRPELVASVLFPEGAVDVDTEEQYKALLNQPGSSSIGPAH
ncbi:nucleotidyltransferase family protein [Hymenobacter taeanensis]|uniref:Nucleotidyltransferase family protein n=1 Tax=Hymenobacter taeanensis TaxID=2735321 RepID=A0A6M6BJ25_9BACT|nr:MULTISPECIES: nucleotidyltransferase family protein [Hymenobacter]QJX48117.1 nucleotidyltransferase family protein [Hymenobacter taeanensis]UOQ82416.1 nucleotidyltransferase family protein [Hymenobacter sp. 5414T-23]